MYISLSFPRLTPGKKIIQITEIYFSFNAYFYDDASFSNFYSSYVYCDSMYDLFKQTFLKIQKNIALYTQKQFLFSRLLLQHYLQECRHQIRLFISFFFQYNYSSTPLNYLIKKTDYILNSRSRRLGNSSSTAKLLCLPPKYLPRSIISWHHWRQN